MSQPGNPLQPTPGVLPPPSTLGAPGTHPGATPGATLQGLRPIEGVLNMNELYVVAGACERNVKQALRGEYVTLDTFLSNLVVNAEVDHAGETSGEADGTKPRRGKKLIYNYISWSEAWTNYMRLMVNYHGPQLFNVMTAYQMHILDFDRKYVWRAVHSFDVAHRGALSYRSVKFDDINVLTANTYMNSTTIKPNAPKCSKCGSYDHLIFACPFRGDDALPEAPRRPRSAGHDRYF